MAEYTYLWCDLRTDQLLAELPMQGVTYGWQLNGVGTLRGVVPLTAETMRLDPITATRPRRTAVYVERDGVLLWGGIVWTRDRAEGGVEVQASEFLSYYQHRHLTTDTLSTDPDALPAGLKGYVDQGGWRLRRDQRQMVQNLLWWTTYWPGGDIGLDLSALMEPCGVERDRTYEGQAEFPVIYDLISNLASVQKGFDFGVEVGVTDGGDGPPTRYRRVQVYYPRRGRTADISGLAWWAGPGGSLLDYDWPEDGASSATQAWAIGESGVNWSWARDLPLLEGGEPLLETVTTYDSVTDISTLAEHAEADLAAARLLPLPVFTVSGGSSPPLGSYHVGDEAVFSIDPGEDPRWPDGMSQAWRITGIDVSVPDSGGPETVKITTGRPADG